MGTERREDQVGVRVVEGGQRGGTGQVMDLRIRAHQVVKAAGVGRHGRDTVASPISSSRSPPRTSTPCTPLTDTVGLLETVTALDTTPLLATVKRTGLIRH
ncbi:hypothetical protein [Streptomyces violascens]|uniref:hypothetical protein n=1 Tax=Streptomyces violascens TaxID=67381 RepID=UPI003666163C